MKSQDADIELRSVIFLAGHFDELFLSGSGSGFSQLDGVLELLDFANSYVLSDRIALGGAPILGLGEISSFLQNLAEESEAIEIIGHGSSYQFHLCPFEDRPRMDSLSQRIAELDRVQDRYSVEQKQCFDEINLLEARAYILLADAKAAAYVPDRLFGVRALERYPEVLDQSDHLREHETFRHQLAEQLRSRPGDESFICRVPSFLLKALHEAQTWKGMFAALKDLRYSASAQHYRDLARRSRSDDPKERRESRVELTRNIRSAFEREGLSGGLNRWVVPTAALSAAAVAFLIPAAAPIAGLLGAAPPLMDSLRAWYRDRNNLFEIYDRAIGDDLYDELLRVFPGIKFGRENLSHFLSKRDFGWSEDLDFWRHVRS